MTLSKLLTLSALMSISLNCMSQEITLEEMQALDQWRAGYAAKGIQLNPEDEVRLLQRLRALRAIATPSPSATSPTTANAPAIPLAAPAATQSLLSTVPQTTATVPAQQEATAPIQLAVPMAPQAATSSVQPVQIAPVNRQLDTQTEPGLLEVVSTLPKMARLANFSYVKDGLKFNDQTFVDPEGIAQRFSVDPETATAAYIVPNGDHALVKIVRLGSGADPITIGKLVRNGNHVAFQSNAGKSIAGDLFFPLTDGILVMRNAVGFRYVVGEGVTQINFPEGWSPAPIQRGNTSTTGWILLERDMVEQKKESIFSLIKDIGEIVGLAPGRMDYALFNLKSSKLVPFELSLSGKSVATYSQCRKASNGLVNICDRMATYDSIWDNNGRPNKTHYFWSVDWQTSQGKPFVVAMEKNLRQLNAVDLTSLKKVNLFERTMGITNWSLDLADQGKYRAMAQLALDKQTLDDVSQEIQTRPALANQ